MWPPCPGCGKELSRLKESFTPKKPSGYHVRGECPECGRWIKWVPYSESDLVKIAIDQYVIRSNNG